MHRHYRLTARHDADSLLRDRRHVLGERATRVISFAMQRLTSMRLISQCGRGALGPFQGQVVVANDHVGHALEDRVSYLHSRADFTRHRSLRYARTASGARPHTPRRFNTATASPTLLQSPAVSPDPIVAKSLPGTSERIRPSTRAPPQWRTVAHLSPPTDVAAQY